MARSDGVSPPRSSAVKTSTSAIFVDERRSIQWLEEHQSRLLMGLGVFVVLLLVSFLVIFYNRYQRSSALEVLRNGIAALQDGKTDEAIAQLEKAAARLGSNETLLARYYLDEAYLRSGKADEAKKIAGLNSTQLSNDPSYLSQLILLTEGKAAEKQNDLSVARKKYEDASALEGPFSVEALWALARVADLTGDTNAATAAREKILTLSSNSPLAEVIRQKLGK
jgi:hypothetical protein